MEEDVRQKHNQGFFSTRGSAPIYTRESKIPQKAEKSRWQGKTWIRAVALLILVVFVPEQAAWAMGFDPTTIWFHNYYVNQGKDGFLTNLVADNIKQSLDSLAYKHLNQIQLSDDLVITAKPLNNKIEDSGTLLEPDVNLPPQVKGVARLIIKGAESVLKGIIGAFQRFSDPSSLAGVLADFLKGGLVFNRNLPYQPLTPRQKQLPRDSLYLTSTEVKKIHQWLKQPQARVDQNCAVLSLLGLLENYGIKITPEELAIKLILVDFLSGSLREFKGTLEISLFALNKVADSLGLKTTVVKLEAEKLSPEFSDIAPFIAYLSPEHFVLVTSIEEDKINFKDGREQAWLPKKDFIQKFSGNCLIIQSENYNFIRIPEKAALGIKGADKIGEKIYSFAKEIKSSVFNEVKYTFSKAKIGGGATLPKVDSMEQGAASSTDNLKFTFTSPSKMLGIGTSFLKTYIGIKTHSSWLGDKIATGNWGSTVSSLITLKNRAFKQSAPDNPATAFTDSKPLSQEYIASGSTTPAGPYYLYKDSYGDFSEVKELSQADLSKIQVVEPELNYFEMAGGGASTVTMKEANAKPHWVGAKVQEGISWSYNKAVRVYDRSHLKPGWKNELFYTEERIAQSKEWHYKWYNPKTQTAKISGVTYTKEQWDASWDRKEASYRQSTLTRGEENAQFWNGMIFSPNGAFGTVECAFGYVSVGIINTVRAVKLSRAGKAVPYTDDVFSRGYKYIKGGINNNIIQPVTSRIPTYSNTKNSILFIKNGFIKKHSNYKIKQATEKAAFEVKYGPIQADYPPMVGPAGSGNGVTILKNLRNLRLAQLKIPKFNFGRNFLKSNADDAAKPGMITRINQFFAKRSMMADDTAKLFPKAGDDAAKLLPKVGSKADDVVKLQQGYRPIRYSYSAGRSMQAMRISQNRAPIFLRNLRAEVSLTKWNVAKANNILRALINKMSHRPKISSFLPKKPKLYTSYKNFIKSKLQNNQKLSPQADDFLQANHGISYNNPTRIVSRWAKPNRLAHEGWSKAVMIDSKLGGPGAKTAGVFRWTGSGIWRAANISIRGLQLIDRAFMTVNPVNYLSRRIGLSPKWQKGLYNLQKLYVAISLPSALTEVTNYPVPLSLIDENGDALLDDNGEPRTITHGAWYTYPKVWSYAVFNTPLNLGELSLTEGIVVNLMEPGVHANRSIISGIGGLLNGLGLSPHLNKLTGWNLPINDGSKRALENRYSAKFQADAFLKSRLGEWGAAAVILPREIFTWNLQMMPLSQRTATLNLLSRPLMFSAVMNPVDVLIGMIQFPGQLNDEVTNLPGAGPMEYASLIGKIFGLSAGSNAFLPRGGSSSAAFATTAITGVPKYTEASILISGGLELHQYSKQTDYKDNKYGLSAVNLNNVNRVVANADRNFYSTAQGAAAFSVIVPVAGAGLRRIGARTGFSFSSPSLTTKQSAGAISTLSLTANYARTPKEQKKSLSDYLRKQGIYVAGTAFLTSLLMLKAGRSPLKSVAPHFKYPVIAGTASVIAGVTGDNFAGNKYSLSSSVVDFVLPATVVFMATKFKPKSDAEAQLPNPADVDYLYNVLKSPRTFGTIAEAGVASLAVHLAPSSIIPNDMKGVLYTTIKLVAAIRIASSLRPGGVNGIGWKALSHESGPGGALKLSPKRTIFSVSGAGSFYLGMTNLKGLEGYIDEPTRKKISPFLLLTGLFLFA
ncbi:MAG: cysteine peptidase family C39 domain-containing protein, partial [Candidatus Omnitrophota bacterium]